jgi:hypothetical protein
MIFLEKPNLFEKKIPLTLKNMKGIISYFNPLTSVRFAPVRLAVLK